MVTNKPLFIGFLLIVIATPFVYGFFTPLTEEEKRKFREEIRGQNVSKLENLLETKIHFDKKILILDELGRNANSDSQHVLEEFAEKMKRNVETSPRDVISSMLHATAQINLAKIKTGEEDYGEYVSELEKLLLKGDKFTQEAVAIELGKLSTQKAKEILLKYENKPDIPPRSLSENFAQVKHLQLSFFCKNENLSIGCIYFRKSQPFFARWTCA